MKVIRNVSPEKWTEIVSRSPDATFFHTYEWARVIQDTYGYEMHTRLYLFDNGKEVLVPLMKTHSVDGGLFGVFESMPFGCYGGLLSTDALSQKEAERIVTDLRQMRAAKMALYPNPLSSVSLSKDIISAHAYTHILSLRNGFDYIWTNDFTSKVRNQARKAEKSEVEVYADSSLNAFETYYAMYLDSGKRWEQVADLHPFSLFANLAELRSEHVNLWLARIGNKVIAGVLNFSFGRQVMWWAAAYYKEYGMYCPNNLLLKTAITDACQRGFEVYNFGASMNLENVRRFKESFGAKRLDYPCYTIYGK